MGLKVEMAKLDYLVKGGKYFGYMIRVMYLLTIWAGFTEM